MNTPVQPGEEEGVRLKEDTTFWGLTGSVRKPKTQMKIKNEFVRLLLLLFLLPALSCEKESSEQADVLEKLYQTYADGEISECVLEGGTVYTGSLNHVDSPTKVYDQQGNQIAECNYAWGKVDAVCEELINCEAVYRVADHISGNPAVDKYGLAR